MKSQWNFSYQVVLKLSRIWSKRNKKFFFWKNRFWKNLFNFQIFEVFKNLRVNFSINLNTNFLNSFQYFLSATTFPWNFKRIQNKSEPCCCNIIIPDVLFVMYLQLNKFWLSGSKEILNLMDLKQSYSSK